VVRPLARGGMGVVYLGRVEGSAGFAKPVVVKCVLSLGDEGENARLFAREARIVSNLQHPGIVAVIDFGIVDGTPVMVLEYVHGYHFGQWAKFAIEKRGLLPVSYALHVVLEVLDALAYAHSVERPDGTSLGIVHRDISPGNVLIDVNGRVKLSDFGIARTADDEFKTQEGLFRGTLAFSAPEALHGAPADPKMDQYSAAVLLYYALAGKNPFKGAEPPETITRVLTFDPPRITSVRSDVPDDIAHALTRALSKDPDSRFQSVSEFADALRSGYTRSERATAEAFTEQIHADFSGEELAERLNVEPLSVRDASWREAQQTPTGVSLSSTPPEIVRANPQAPAEPATQVLSITRKLPILGERNSSFKVALPLGLALALIAAVVGLVVVLRAPPPAASRVVVIEKHAEAPPPAAAPSSTTEAAGADLAVAPTASTAAVPVAKRAPVSPPAPTATSRGGSLAAAFQRQEAAIQSCYRQHAEGVEQPALSVRFQIDEAGAVRTATVSPSSIAAAPLGQCIVGIARKTSFGPQSEPISFAIPIAARKVQR
jgi:serine/threonine protein kinase